MRTLHRLAVVAVVAPVLALSACGGSSTTVSASSSSSGFTSKAGVSVVGAFGTKPTLKVPTSKPPTDLQVDVVSAGTGATVVKGDSLVVNYLGQTWTPKNGAANVFDNSFDAKKVFATTIGTGSVIKGWDQGLVGQKLGSRVLLTIPASLAYGTDTSSSSGLGGQELLFVVDLIDQLDPNAAATGTPAAALPATFGTVTSVSGKPPVITSVKGVKVGKEPTSALLLSGTGATIDSTKTLALQVTQTDVATGKKTQASFGTPGPQMVLATQVLPLVTALRGEKVGSRAIAVIPASGSTAATIVIVDILGQY